MTHCRNNVKIVVVQNQSFNIRHFVEGLALDLFNTIIGQVDHFQLLVLAPDPQQIPGQSFKVISVENKNFCLLWGVLYHIRVGEPRVCAVRDVDLFVRLPLPIIPHTTAASLLISFWTPSVVPLVPHIAGGQREKGAQHQH